MIFPLCFLMRLLNELAFALEIWYKDTDDFFDKKTFQALFYSCITLFSVLSHLVNNKSVN
jgi:hypothetical protein